MKGINFTALQKLDEAREEIKKLQAQLALTYDAMHADMAKRMGCPSDMAYDEFLQLKLYNAQMYEDRLGQRDRGRMIRGFTELWEQVEDEMGLETKDDSITQRVINTYRHVLETNRSAIIAGIKQDIDTALLVSSLEPGGTRISESTKHRAAEWIFEHYLEP